jgi:hypothetical protein
MVSILNERQLTDEDRERLSEEKSPTIIDPKLDLMLGVKKLTLNQAKKSTGYGTYSREETRKLLEADNKPVTESNKFLKFDYPTYSRKEASQLVIEDAEYKEEEKRKALEWQISRKMTASEEKMERRMRHMNSSKDLKD